MKKLMSVLILSLLMIFNLVSVMKYGVDNKIESQFGLDQFTNEIKGKGYSFKIENIENHFSSEESKVIFIDNKIIEIYAYKTNLEMEREAKCFSRTGNWYDNGDEKLEVDWIKEPRLYKKGKIIVSYIGEDEKLTDELTDILGNQFAGKH